MSRPELRDGQILPLRPGEWCEYDGLDQAAERARAGRLSDQYRDVRAAHVRHVAGGAIITGHDVECAWGEGHPPCVEIWVTLAALAEAPSRSY